MPYTTIDNPELYFQTKLYTGTESSNSVTLDGSEDMQPDWVWIKVRSNSTHGHNIYDSVRGVNKPLQSETTSAEGNDASSGNTSLNSFDSDGFTLGGFYHKVNQSGQTFVAWNWKAGTTSGISGSPSITPSAYSFNQTAGVSIIAYTGNASVGATIPHGLGVAPAVIIFKNRDSNVKWVVYHHKNTSTPETDHLVLNTTAATSDDDSILNDTAPSSTLITMKTSSAVNSNSVKYIAYCFSEIKGYSKFGSYTGNGNADGTFLYTGFKPSWLMYKRTDSAHGWFMLDNKRDTFNVSYKMLRAESSSVEDTGSSPVVDFLSNGFKMRNTYNSANASGGTYIYMAFAESPFVNSNGIPNNAR